MKKQFILAGLLAVGFASAQTDKAHLGKVGINIMTPQATIDIRPNDDNSQETATTNEGILIPKLSKTRVANIEDTLLVEGTLVYVTDDASSTIASYAGNNAKVTKITEKGYYYYDGTEWVKAKNTPQDQEWVYDLATNRITLKRSGGDLFGNQIFYNRKGGFINQNMISYDYLNASANLTPSGYPTGTLVTETLDIDATPYNAHYKKIDASTYTPTILGAPRHILNRGILYATDTSVDNTSFLIGDDIQVATSPSNTKNYMFQMATYSVARHDGQGDSKYMVGTYSDARLSSGKSTGYVVGGRFTAAYNSNQSSNQQIGVVSNNQLLVNATGEISHLSNFAGTNNFLSQNSLSIVALRGVEVSNKMKNMKGTLSITDSRGFFMKG
ncbi:hypothetical protein ACFFUE_03780 [Bergeyella porcorum]|uniref:hypothetical protein n=1 Tax=Bergeyella porcorum TaxID=1735111 RepID=UPI0035EAD8B6